MYLVGVTNRKLTQQTDIWVFIKDPSKVLPYSSLSIYATLNKMELCFKLNSWKFWDSLPTLNHSFHLFMTPFAENEITYLSEVHR